MYDIDKEMLRWSQTVYGIAHSLQIVESINMGNLDTLMTSLRNAAARKPSDLGFESSIDARDFGENAVKLDGRDHAQVFDILSDNVTELLFVNLAVLADECLAQCMANAGANVPNYLTAKVEWIKPRLDQEHRWAANGLLELCAIRNAIVHNEGRLGRKSVELLLSADVTNIKEDHRIQLSFGDLFRYRRALRTVVGEARKLAVRH